MKTLHVLVFGSGAILMSLEVLGSRLMAPYFGSSVYVWGSLISVFLTALSAGYYLGGELADRKPQIQTLADLLLAAGLLTSLVPAFGERIAEALSTWGPRAGPLSAAGLIFLLPTLVMGMVSPVAIRLGVSSLQQVGQAAGRLSAVSTAGSIAGTLLTTFFLVPLAGTKLLMTLLAGGLFGLAALAFFHEQKRTHTALALVAALGLGLFGPSGPLSDRYGVGPSGVLRTVYQTESAYHNIRVMDGSGVRYLRFDRSWQTGMDLADPYRSLLSYPDYFHLAMANTPGIRDVLVVGLGGGAAPKKFWRDYPQVAIDVVELDPRVVEIAREYFSVPQDDRLNLIVADGRRYLEETRKQYDLIILDAYYSDSVPFHLVTREFARSLKERLRPGGTVAFNLIGALEGQESAFVRSVYKTVGEVLPARVVVPVDWRLSPDPQRRGNVILFAAETGLEPERFKRAAQSPSISIRVDQLAQMADEVYTRPILTQDVPVLTDDHAPVEKLIKVMD